MEYQILICLVFGIQLFSFGHCQQCVPKRLYPEPLTGCRQFRICDNDGRLSHPLDCAQGTLFDERLQMCEHHYKVRCSDRPSPADCREGAVAGSKCRAFIRCDFGRSHFIICPERTVYSTEYRVCAYPFFLSTRERQDCGLFGPFF